MAEVLVNSAKVDLTLQDAHRNTALHLACSKVTTPLTTFDTHVHNSPTACIFIRPTAMFQGHETCALLILEKISDRNLINCTNAALQT